MQKQKLSHIRTKDKNGNINSKGGITISGMVDENNQVIRFATAFCHSRDNYNRKTGKIKATSRMHSGHASVLNQKMDWSTVVDDYIKEAETLRKEHVASQIAKLEAKKEALTRKITKLSLEY